MNEVYGYLFVIGAIIMFGSFAAPIIALKNIKINPFVIQFYQSLAVGISCQLVTTFADFNYDPILLVSSLIYVLVNMIVQICIKLIGISIPISIIGSSTIISSFLWGIIAFPSDNIVTNVTFVSISMILLIFGIVIVGSCRLLILQKTDDKYKLILKNDKAEHSDQIANKQIIIAIILALMGGILNGTSLVPIQYVANIKKVELITLIAFYGLGIIFITNITNVIFVFCYYYKIGFYPDYYFSESFPQLFASGIIWNIGFGCSIYATKILGLSIAFPLSQLSLIVNGFWGIVVFKEFKEKFNISLWCLGVLIVLIGAGIYSQSIN